ncbi:MAG: NAD(P)-dependent oxidoreductase [Candidatus Levyibacteriota bacterium]
MTKIAAFELEPWEEKFLSDKLGSSFEIFFFDHSLKQDDVEKIKDVEALVVFIYSRVTKEIIDTLPNLKFIATMSTGFDHIDLATCKARNIIVSNVRGYGEITVAEHTFALLLALSHRIVESYERVKEGYFSPEGLTGFDISGKTLGVIGVGSIGKHVIEIAHGFGMNVLGYTRTPDPELEKKLNFKSTDMDTLLTTSDIITLHVPFSPETQHMINEEAIQKMKDGVIILNTSRGGLIDTKAMLKYVENKKIGGVGLDVCEAEPALREEKQLLSKEFNSESLMHILEEKMLLNHKNVIITPHNAFNSREALELILSTTVANIEGYKNNAPQNVVPLEQERT